MTTYAVRLLSLAVLVLTLTASHPAAGQIPDLKTRGSVPTLAPLVRQVTPAVVAQLRNTIGLARVGEDVKLALLRNGAPLNVVVRIAPALEQGHAFAGGNRVVR